MKPFKTLEEFTNEAKKNNVFEITDSKGMDRKDVEKALEKAWTKGITYKGMEFFDKIYMEQIMDVASDELGIGNAYDEDCTDEDDEDYTAHQKIDGQECYLGYIPSKDIFVSGWDMWETECGDEFENTVLIEVDLSGKAKKVTYTMKKLDLRGMFYGNNCYEKLHKTIKDLIDIRLD